MREIEEIVSQEAFQEWLQSQPDDRVVNDWPNIPITHWLQDMFHRPVRVRQYMIIVRDIDEDGDMEFTTPDWMDSYIETFIMSDTETAGEWKEYFSDHDQMWRLFVYGTLKSGHGNNRLMVGGKLIQERARINGYILTGGGIPFAKTRPDGHIIGELWELPKYQVLGPIDSLEGHPHWYKRTWTDQLDGTWFYLCDGGMGRYEGLVSMFEGHGYNEWPSHQYVTRSKKRNVHKSSKPGQKRKKASEIG